MTLPPFIHSRGTLRARTIQQIGAMIVGIVVVSGVSLRGLNGLGTDFGVALGGYRELREIYDVGMHVATAKKVLASDSADTGRAGNELDAAVAKLDRFLAGPASPGGAVVLASDKGKRLTSALRASLRAAITNLQLPADDAFHPGGAQHAEVDRAISQVAAIGAEIQRTISARETAARNKWQTTLTLVTGVSIVVVCGAILLGIVQYRGVISPLRRLRSAAGNIAAGHFADRVETGGPAEFAELADDFNRMATELQSLYRDLEQKVATKSAELARAERLASVGYLAAGVAHEINNPLSIITGYGERALQHVELQEGETMLAAVEKCLRIMCEEAYRCKTITDQLLSMARSGHENRKPVKLLSVANTVVAALSVLPEYRERPVVVDAPANKDPTVIASEGELKQALMNLLVNALEAVSWESGQVSIRIGTNDGRARMTINDNGRGMTPQTLERIFEPFYTEKRGSNRAGTGLGLSLTHAIVQSHGGTLTAASNGPGTGSRFTIELPLAATGDVV